ncbi:MAG TPA: hypothetical protein VES19_04050 [Candidatus Limnocylindrales bacterium]|nr:hypothetical protein [Candidatus Limnocylindrales bacterium]
MAEHHGRPSWGDERLEAAFASLVPTEAPPEVLASVHERLDEDASRGRRRWALAIAGLSLALTAVVVAAVVAGPWLVRGGPFAGTWFRIDSGTDGTSTLLTDDFRFDFPATWTVTDTAAAFSGGSAIAVLGTAAVPAACGSGHVDINCVYASPLDPGTVQVVVRTRGFRGGSILDRTDIENGTTTRLSVGGMPAILDDFSVTPEDFYRADLSLGWTIAFPTSLTNAVSIDVLARDPGSAEARAAAEALIASFAFNRPPRTLPADDEAGIVAARAAIASEGAGFARGFGQLAGENHLTCQPDRPGVERETFITFSSGGDLGGGVPVTCSWTLAREGDVLWRVDTHVDWAADGRSGRGTEILWLDADGTIVAQRGEGENPPLVTPPGPDPSEAPAATEPPVPSPTDSPVVDPGTSASPVVSGTGMKVLGLDVLTVDEALAGPAKAADGREFAVRGWLTSRAMMMRCPYRPNVSPLLPGCGEGWVFLLRDNQAIPLTVSGQPTQGPFLNPLIRGSVDLETLGSTPQDAILVGHIGDPRAASCPAEQRAACEAAFIVDRVLPATGADTNDPTPWLTGIEPPRTTGAVWAYLATWRTGEQRLSIGIVDSTELASIQPALSGVEGIDAGPVWIVEVLGGPGEATGKRITIIVPDAAVREQRSILTIIVDGEVLRSVTIID